MSPSSSMESFSWENMVLVGTAVNTLSHQISGGRKDTVNLGRSRKRESGNSGCASLDCEDRNLESLPLAAVAPESAIESR